MNTATQKPRVNRAEGRLITVASEGETAPREALIKMY